MISKIQALTTFFILALLFTSFNVQAVVRDGVGRVVNKNLNYRTFFGQCPSRVAGSLTLKLVKTFEKNSSLREVKSRIIKEQLKKKHFISEYKIQFDPLSKLLKLSFDCPKPLMKVQVYANNGHDFDEAILVDNGKLFDPTYEILLRDENKLRDPLPFLALPQGQLGKKVQYQLAKMVGDLDLKFRKKISEVIVNDNKELTMILSLSGKPSSVFLGKNEWDEKMLQMRKIIKYMESKKKIPHIINLTNSKKIVVKFDGKF